MANKKVFVPASILIAGLVLFFVGFAMAGFQLEELSTAIPYEEKTYTDEHVASIVVKDSNVPVEFAVSKENRVTVRYFENEEYQYTIENQNGRLSIEKANHRKWYLHMFSFEWATQDVKLVVMVPESFQGDVAISTSNGQIDFSDGHVAKATLSTSNGRITVQNAETMGNLEVKTSNGRISLDRVKAGGDAQLVTSNANIEVTELTASNIDVKSSAGNISINNTTAALDIKVKSSNGQVVLDQVSAARNVNADTSNSGIKLTKLNVGRSVSCGTSNGKISGTIVGRMEEFSITSSTTNGDNNLPKKTDNGEKNANFKTSNSDIEIAFEK